MGPPTVGLGSFTSLQHLLGSGSRADERNEAQTATAAAQVSLRWAAQNGRDTGAGEWNDRQMGQRVAQKEELKSPR